MKTPLIWIVGIISHPAYHVSMKVFDTNRPLSDLQGIVLQAWNVWQCNFLAAADGRPSAQKSVGAPRQACLRQQKQEQPKLLQKMLERPHTQGSSWKSM